jgi:hypothetical protein
VQEPGLYFPFIHVRDDDWLKGAALYWPWIGRLSPEGYRKHDTRTALEFAEARVLRDQDPGMLLYNLQWDLLDALRRNSKRLQADYSIECAYRDWGGRSWGSAEDPGHAEELGWIHISKISRNVLDYLVRHNLAAVGRGVEDIRTGGKWIGLHPALAGAYMTALAGQIGTDRSLEPVTDQSDLRTATPNTAVESALNLLIGNRPVRSESQAPTDDYLMLAFQCVLPKNLAAVPVAKIIECRTTLEGELQTFRDHVRGQQSELRELAALPDPQRRIEAFSEHVEQSIEVPLRELEKSLRLLKLEPARTLMVSGVTAAGSYEVAHAMHSPSVHGTTTAFAAIVGAWWQIKSLRGTATKASPVGYLLDVRDRLTPATLSTRIRKAYTGTAARP